ncbi:MAG: PD-(D/E)XK nuclease family transposase, partial [bacterium]
MQFADPRTDFAFKKIFGNEKAKDIVISFLNAVLGLDAAHAIVEVTILNPYEAPKTKYMRASYVDVKCVDVRGISYIVEMQVAYVAGFE